jgi:hypothetical protein
MTKFEKLLLLLLVNMFKYWIVTNRKWTDQATQKLMEAKYDNFTSTFINEINIKE